MFVDKTVTRLEITWLRWRARGALVAIHFYAADLECGIALACYISPRIARRVDLFNRCAARLEEIDPEFPAGCRAGPRGVIGRIERDLG